MSTYKWTKILGIVGIVIGAMSAIDTGVRGFSSILGFSVPYGIVFMAAGFFFDLVGNKFK